VDVQQLFAAVAHLANEPFTPAVQAFSLMSLRPLDGFLVGITADRRAEEQAELLRRRGAAVLHGPTISTQYLADEDNLRAATRTLIAEPPDYVVATTGIGMRAWLEAAQTWGLGDRLTDTLSGARIVARGPKAAGAVAGAGLDVWARSTTEQLDDLVRILRDQCLAGRRVAVQQYGEQNPAFTATLAAEGAVVVEVPVYRWLLPEERTPAVRLIEAVRDGQVDAVTFTSAPAVANLFAIGATVGEADNLRRAFNGRVTAACVGPVCAEGALREGIEAPLTPDVGRLGLLVRALSESLHARRRRFQLDGVELVLQGSAVVADGQEERLAAKERAVLQVLASAPGTVVSRDRLLTSVWGAADTDPHLLEATVSRLRSRLGRCAGAVAVRPGRGYWFIAREI
jgi:uroporphyrinogen-III synthase